MTLETAQFLSAAAGIPQERERLWVWCQCHGTQTDYVLVSRDGTVTTWVCPDCGRVVEVERITE